MNTWGINEAELANLWALSKTALPNGSKYERKIWTTTEYHKAHPDTSITAAYKVLDRSPWT